MKQKRCVVIGSSPYTKPSDFSGQIQPGDYIVCADGGYLFALQQGLRPELIVGDFDSSAFPYDYEGEIIRLPHQKDDTDTLYCVKECIRRGYNDFTFIGMLGGREDHTYANLCTLLYLSQQDCCARLVSSEREIQMISHGRLEISHRQGLMFSIFPFGCRECTVSLQGFLYELKEGTLTANFPLGVSNEITSPNACLTVHRGTAVVFIGKSN